MSGRTSVVVLSYRPGEWLAPCLESVRDQANEVILVDNGSDGSSASLTARQVGVKVVRSERNLGFAGGVNFGVANSTGDVLALLNDDAVAGPGWLAAAERALTDGVAAVGPKVVLAGRWREVVLDDEPWFAPGDARPLGRRIESLVSGGRDVLAHAVGPGIHRLETAAEGSWRWTAGRRPFYIPFVEGEEPALNGAPLPPGRVCSLVNSAGMFLRADGYAGDIGADRPDDGSFDEACDRFGLSGTALVFRRATWERLGPLATPFFAYYEDVDWCWRAQLLGLRLRYDPSASVTHRRSATSGGGETVRVLAESNRTLTLVRNAPSSVARQHLVKRWKDGPRGGVRRRVAARLPWAVSSRVSSSRRWAVRPGDVWDRWVQ